MSKNDFYTLDEILKTLADYYVVYGERGNGKTTAALTLCLFGYHKNGIDINGYLDDGSQMAYIRRWEEDFKGNNALVLYDAIIKLKLIEKKTKGKYNSVVYRSKKWFLAKYNDKGERILIDETPFTYGFSLSSEEHYKSTSYPNINFIVFDEFITRGYYLPDEFIKFQNLLSTIIRLKDNVKIFMLGNTINKFGCPYINEMGLSHMKTQERGSIDVYKYGDNELKVAVEFSTFKGSKKSNKYFAFDNPKLNMIKNGSWEIDIYPHLPAKYKRSDILYIFYILYDGETLQCNIINVDNNMFIYIHKKTTPLPDNVERLVYQLQPDYRINYRTNILKPYDTKIEKIIYKLFKFDKVFYQDNMIGEIVYNYVKSCVK